MAIMISLALVMTSFLGRPAGSDSHFTRETTFITTPSNLEQSRQQVQRGRQALGKGSYSVNSSTVYTNISGVEDRSRERFTERSTERSSRMHRCKKSSEVVSFAYLGVYICS